jgi:rubrerythrin
MAIQILYRGHNGERRIYNICRYCGTAFYDNTFTPPYVNFCPVCGCTSSEVNKEEFETYIKDHNNLADSISMEGCADRMPGGTEK